MEKKIMRTNTKTFRYRIVRDLRAQGVSSKAAKAAHDMIVKLARDYGYPVFAADATICIGMLSDTMQEVYINDNGIARFCVILDAEFQPLVKTEATAEQIALRDEMEAMMTGDLYDAEGAEKERLNALYTAKRDAVLAINPFVHASYADPDGYEFYHNIHKSEYGFRPRGFLTYAMMLEQIEMICNRSNERKAA